MIFLFDVDGLINKSDYFTFQYVKDFDVDKSIFKDFFQNNFAQCLKGHRDVREVIKPYFGQWKWEKSPDDFLEYWFEKDVKLDSQLLDYVQQLRKDEYYCALASQQEGHRKNHLWESRQLRLTFDDFYCSCDIGLLKSDPAFFETIIQQLKDRDLIEKPSQVVFWDDMEKFTRVAKTMGITAKLFRKNEDIINFLDQLK
ncbi:MAG: HAD hydrolase-like protein [Bacteroidota bacterium]